MTFITNLYNMALVLPVWWTTLNGDHSEESDLDLNFDVEKLNKIKYLLVSNPVLTTTHNEYQIDYR